MKKYSTILGVIVVIVFSFWAIRPLLNSGFFPMHDDTQVARVFVMKKALSDGQLPVRIVQDLGYGYGYPIFNFYAPLAYYVGGSINLLGFDALFATKMMMVLGIVLSGVFMYLLARIFWGEIGGVIAGLLYLYAPYHAVNIYVRGAVAEFWAYAFLPLIFLGMYNVYLKTIKYLNEYDKKKTDNNQRALFKRSIWAWTSVTAVSYACVILSHNLTAMMVTPFIFSFGFMLYIALRSKDKVYRPYNILLGLLLGVLLAAFYWIPVFPELKYTNVLSVVGGGSDYKDHFVCLGQLWSGPWGFGGSIPGCLDGLSFKIGKVHILLFLMAMPAILFIHRTQKLTFAIMILFLINVIISVFLMIPSSKFIWDAIPQMAFFQFPWRFLILTTFLMSFFGGGVAIYLRGRSNLIGIGVGILIIIGLIYQNYKLFVPQEIFSVRADDIINKNNLNWKISRISDEYMPRNFVKPLTPKYVPSAKVVKNNNVKISNFKEKSNLISFFANTNTNTTLGVNLAYFPGWHVFVDDEQVWFKHFNKGIMIDIPKGGHLIEIRYIQTNIEKLGNTISLVGAIIIISGIIAHRKHKRYV